MRKAYFKKAKLIISGCLIIQHLWNASVGGGGKDLLLPLANCHIGTEFGAETLT